MGFFASFWSWLNVQLGTYISANTARVSMAIEPAIVTLATLYVMVWGYLHMMGRIEEPFGEGLKRIITLAIVLGVCLRLWLYNAVIVDTFYTAPTQLAALVVGSSDPVQTLDTIWASGGSVADTLWNNGGVLDGEIGYYIAGVAVWAIMGVLCVYTMFLIALSHVALAVLLALGPLFIAMLPFNGTRRMFDAWLGQLANYGLITVLTIMCASLLLQIVASYAEQTAARGSAILTVDALDMLLMAVLVFLFMRQIMPIASSLAGGGALTTFGGVSRAVSWSMQAGGAAARVGLKTTAALLTRGTA